MKIRKVLNEEFVLNEAYYTHPNNIEKKQVKIEEEVINNVSYKVIRNVLLQVGNIKNKNNRIYDWEELVKAVNTYNEKKAKYNAGYGEFNHSDQEVVNLERVSHLIKNFNFDTASNRIYGDIYILNFTPTGALLLEYIKRGFLIGISSRALGDIEEKSDSGGEYVLVKNIDIIAWDIVATPSVHGAYLKDINLEEAKKNKSVIIEDIENIYNEITKG